MGDEVVDEAVEEGGGLPQVVRRPVGQGGAHAPAADVPYAADRDPARIGELDAGAGLEVTPHTEGEPGPVTAGAELTAYRIVQEALTNVTKHAGARTAAIRLVYAEDLLTVAVTDDGGAHPKVPASVGGGGYGLIGMRERARSADGRVRTGHRPGGGFEVVAELPLHTRRTNESHPV
ncbi:sensor histidine kinase [Streptomyces sp. NPDC060002]|uniref:sensor histidine kinase n=1 Tax=Streptomyces sp. NPDC060002 TaxID=3347033 RepID=UPI00369BD499